MTHITCPTSAHLADRGLAISSESDQWVNIAIKLVRHIHVRQSIWSKSASDRIVLSARPPQEASIKNSAPIQVTQNRKSAHAIFTNVLGVLSRQALEPLASAAAEVAMSTGRLTSLAP